VADFKDREAELEIIIKGKNSEVPKDLKAYAETKLAKLTKLMRRLQSARITFTKNASKKRDRAYRVEAVLTGPGQTMRAVVDEASFYIAVDSAVDKLRRQLKKRKSKREDKQREKALRKSAVVSELPPVVAEEPEEASAPTVQIMNYSVRPMTTTEAILQLEVSGGEMLLFVDEHNVVQCLCKRLEGGYTLLVPEGESV
jgi:putative sigma-54 modulation protein